MSSPVENTNLQEIPDDKSRSKPTNSIGYRGIEIETVKVRNEDVPLSDFDPVEENPIMSDKYYKFNDGHPTGGSSVVTITESQILEHMRQFTDHTGLTDDQLIIKFTQDRKATPIPTPTCKNTKKTCNRDDKCCKNQVTSGFVPDSNYRTGTEL